jgi:DNA-nicking Smr family endonuclease
MTRRPRKLFPEERELWDRVVGSATPLHPKALRDPAQPEAEKPSKHMPRLPEFRIGETAKRPQTRIDLQPSLGERIASHAIRMDRSAHRQMKRGRIAPEARIDLHGMTLGEAHPELIRFILNAQSGGLRLVLVITGKGKHRDDTGPIPARVGALRHQVPHWLTLAPLGQVVLQVATAHLKHGGDGAYYVYLRRNPRG